MRSESRRRSGRENPGGLAEPEERVSLCGCDSDAAQHLERRTLSLLLAINGVLFVVEAIVGWMAQSTGLLADSLDMLADAAVYGVALYAAGRSVSIQRGAAFASGVVQITLGVGVLIEVLRRILSGGEPLSTLMMGMGGVALFANVSCLFLLARHRRGGVHMRASWIFSTNDVLANLGVILSGLAVWIFDHRFPDLLIGGLISMAVICGGFRILQQTRRSDPVSAS